MLGQFQLSLDAGIGNYLFRSGRVLRRESPEAERDPQIRSEFDLLGTRVAIPVLDRESLVGVALFDGRVTGEAMVNEELALIFHLLEQLGLAIKNKMLHDQVSARHQMLLDIFGADQIGVRGDWPRVERASCEAKSSGRIFSEASGRSADRVRVY